jgi:alpha-beta hydrolase superfamily lysophospholipase
VKQGAWLAAFLAGVLMLIARPAIVEGRAQRVLLRTSDGVLIAGTFFEASRRPAPAVILLHMLTRTRRDWEPLASRLAAEGIAVLTIDLRGHGESWVARADEPAGLAAMLEDVVAARRYLDTRPDVRHDRIGLAGASLGASLAVLAGANDPSVRSLALLSPSLDYRGVRIDQGARKYGARPMLLVASREDAYAIRTLRELGKADAGREQLLLEQAGHGTTMLSRDPSLARALVDWFHRTLI